VVEAVDDLQRIEPYMGDTSIRGTDKDGAGVRSVRCGSQKAKYSISNILRHGSDRDKLDLPILTPRKSCNVGIIRLAP
jgi:hypothetical protein